MSVVFNKCGDRRELSKNVNPLRRCPLCGSPVRVRVSDTPEPIVTDEPTDRVPKEKDLEEPSEVEDDVSDESP